MGTGGANFVAGHCGLGVSGLQSAGPGKPGGASLKLHLRGLGVESTALYLQPHARQPPGSMWGVLSTQNPFSCLLVSEPALNL